MSLANESTLQSILDHLKQLDKCLDKLQREVKKLKHDALPERYRRHQDNPSSKRVEYIPTPNREISYVPDTSHPPT